LQPFADNAAEVERVVAAAEGGGGIAATVAAKERLAVSD